MVSYFPKRKENKETGEIVLILIVVDNGLVLYFKDFDRKEYTS